MRLIILIFFGGGLGSILRFGISKVIQNQQLTSLPIATFLANVLSCIVIGVIVSNVYFKDASTELKSFLLIGFCGGLSTFSTFSKENIDLMNSGNLLLTFVNIALNVIVCMLILWCFTSKN